MDVLKKTLTFDLYKNNKEQFHSWLYVKYSAIKSSMWTMFVGLIGAIVLVVAILVTINDRAEISNHDYRELISDRKQYATTIPEFGPMLKDFYSDEIINEGEFDDLQELIYAYNRETNRISRLKTKKSLKIKLQ